MTTRDFDAFPIGSEPETPEERSEQAVKGVGPQAKKPVKRTRRRNAIPPPGAKVPVAVEVGAVKPTPPTPDIVDLIREGVEETSARRLIEGFVSGELPASVLADTGQPARSEVILKPGVAKAASELEERAKKDKGFETFLNRVRTLEQVDPAEIGVDDVEPKRGITGDEFGSLITAPFTSPIMDKADAKHFKGLLVSIADGFNESVLSKPTKATQIRLANEAAELAIRPEIARGLKKRLPKREFIDFLKDANWLDQLREELDSGGIDKEEFDKHLSFLRNTRPNDTAITILSEAIPVAVILRAIGKSFKIVGSASSQAAKKLPTKGQFSEGFKRSIEFANPLRGVDDSLRKIGEATGRQPGFDPARATKQPLTAERPQIDDLIDAINQQVRDQRKRQTDTLLKGAEKTKQETALERITRLRKEKQAAIDAARKETTGGNPKPKFDNDPKTLFKRQREKLEKLELERKRRAAGQLQTKPFEIKKTTTPGNKKPAPDPAPGKPKTSSTPGRTGSVPSVADPGAIQQETERFEAGVTKSPTKTTTTTPTTRPAPTTTSTPAPKPATVGQPESSPDLEPSGEPAPTPMPKPKPTPKTAPGTRKLPMPDPPPKPLPAGTTTTPLTESPTVVPKPEPGDQPGPSPKPTPATQTEPKPGDDPPKPSQTVERSDDPPKPRSTEKPGGKSQKRVPKPRRDDPGNLKQRKKRSGAKQRFPEIAAWKQGRFWKVLDFDTGKITTSLDPPFPGLKVATGDGAPNETFKVIRFDDDPPTQRQIDMGAVRAVIDAGGITYKRKRIRRRRK